MSGPEQRRWMAEVERLDRRQRLITLALVLLAMVAASAGH